MQIKHSKTVVKMTKTEVRQLTTAESLLAELAPHDGDAKVARDAIRVITERYAPAKRAPKNESDDQ